MVVNFREVNSGFVNDDELVSTALGIRKWKSKDQIKHTVPGKTC